VSSIPEQNLFVQWSGCASYHRTIYRVVVVAPKDAFQSDVCKAIRTAGGFNPQVEEEAYHPSKKPVQAPSPGATFTVTFIPDQNLTIGASMRKEASFLLKTSNMLLRDGEFMGSPRAQDKKPQREFVPRKLFV
jgi:hypothetical protein